MPKQVCKTATSPFDMSVASSSVVFMTHAASLWVKRLVTRLWFVLSASDSFSTMALYKSIYLLTYLHVGAEPGCELAFVSH